MIELYRALFVDPSLETLIPILIAIAAGAVLSAIRKVAKIGVTILLVGVAAFVLYLLWQSGALDDALTWITGSIPTAAPALRVM